MHGGFDPALYVPRPEVEEAVAEGLRRDHGLVFRGPARMGKTWLLYWLRAGLLHDWNIVDVNLTLTRSERRENIDMVLYSLAQKISDKLQLGPGAVRRLFGSSGTPADRLADLVKTHLLPDPRPLLLVLDRADELAERKEAAHFFTLIRNWAQMARYNPQGVWSRFHVAVVLRGPAPVYLNLTSDIPIDELSPGQAIDLVHRTGGPAAAWHDGELARLHELIGGQPLLWRLAAQAARDGSSVEDILRVDSKSAERSAFAPHLFWLRERLMNDCIRPGSNPRILRDSAANMLAGRRIDDQEFDALDRVGLVVGDSRNPAFRCPLYRALAEQVCQGR